MNLSVLIHRLSIPRPNCRSLTLVWSLFVVKEKGPFLFCSFTGYSLRPPTQVESLEEQVRSASSPLSHA